MDIPSAAPGYFKAHGLGNDYLVFEAGTAWRMGPDAIRAVCHRWRGVGSDGIVLVGAGTGGGPFSVRMFNPDGSEFERSGNGLRVLASYLAHHGRVGSEPFLVEVGGARVSMRVEERLPGGTLDVSVDMGRASFDPERIGLDPGALDGNGRLPHPTAGAVPIRAVSIGNPHCVVFTDDVSPAAVERLGPGLATHPAFARGTNVQLARVTADGAVEIGIWERGVGSTSASGTSACAVAAAAVKGGLHPPGAIEVRMEGGTLLVTVDREYGIVLRGPVEEVGTGRLTDGFLERLAGKGRDGGVPA